LLRNLLRGKTAQQALRGPIKQKSPTSRPGFLIGLFS
jgi:hypothetical protein